MYQFDMEPVQLRQYGAFNFSFCLVFDLPTLKVDEMCPEMSPLQCTEDNVYYMELQIFTTTDSILETVVYMIFGL